MILILGHLTNPVALFLLGAVVFGLFSVLLILMIHPVICGWVDAVPILYRRVLTVVIFAGFIVDTVSSVCGMVDFQKKMEKHAAALEKRKAIAIGRLKDSAAYETIKQRRNTLSENLTYQAAAYD